MKHTPENITSLAANQVFIFGSNLAGAHGGGAAKVAADLFGAEAGVGEGMTGSSYAFPTLTADYQQLPHEALLEYVSNLYDAIRSNVDKQFILTKVGCGIAGYDEAYMQRLFAKNRPNLIKPVGWDEVIGYKVFESDWKCRDFQYEVGGIYTHEGAVLICNSGFHFCYNVADCFGYYNFDPRYKVAKVRGFGSNDTRGDKVCFANIEIIEEISWHSMLQMANEGQGNTGISNSGSWNSGDRNSGDRNSGDRNSGSSNSGDRNSGSSNSGDRNSGSRNSGDRNSGDRNSGSSNSGSWNSGSRNSGFLNTNEPKLRIFNKETDKKFSDIYFPNWMNFDINVWKWESEMTNEEKEKYPDYEICGGYLFSIDYKEAAQLAYDSATAEEKRSVEDLPNYDADIIFEIFGIDRRKK